MLSANTLRSPGHAVFVFVEVRNLMTLQVADRHVGDGRALPQRLCSNEHKHIAPGSTMPVKFPKIVLLINGIGGYNHIEDVKLTNFNIV